MEIEHQVKREAMVVKFWNQVKASAGPPERTDKYVRLAIDAVIPTQ
jgi:hypothetical protein